MKGILISFEGIDGCGKSTHIRRLREQLEEWGVPNAFYREPGDTTIGDELRKMLLADSYDIAPITETLMFLAARAQLVNDNILPALERGEVVVLDRYSDSTFAYQGYGRGMSLDVLRTMNKFATIGLTPHLTILLDVDYATARQRNLRDSSNSPDRLESEQSGFFERVRQGYLEMAALSPQRIKLVDSCHDIEEVATEVTELILGSLSKHGINVST